MTTHTYPDQTLEKALRARGWRVQCNWQIKGPKDTEIVWMEHLLASDGKGAWGTMIVQTFKGGGWNVYVEPTDRNDLDKTVEAVIKAFSPVPADDEWTDQCHAADRAKEKSE